MSVINGTSGNDTLTGTSGADEINGLDGDDIINGGFGADTLNGGAGNDRFEFTGVSFASPTPPRGAINGGEGIDTIDATSVSPTYVQLTNQGLVFTVGNQGFDVTGVEIFRFGSQSNSFDMFVAWQGAQPLEVYAGGGSDNLALYAGVRAFAEGGDDTVRLSGSFGSGPLIGHADGGEGVDTLWLNIAANANLLTGVATLGEATYSIANFENVTATVAFNYNTTVRGSHGANVIKADGQGLGIAGAAAFFGEGGDDTLIGEANNDTLSGDDGDDILSGRGGHDVLLGGAGNDQLSGDEGDDQLDGGFGNDLLDGGAGNDVLTGGAGIDTLNGGDGIDAVSYATSASGVQVYLDSQVSWDGVSTDSLSSIENAIGSAHADYLGGDAGANRLDGGAGDDFLDGGAGDDVLIGGATGLDHMRGGDGTDTITYAGHATGVQIYLDSDVSWDGVTMDFLSSIENAVGSSNADYIGGNAAANRLDGGAGDDFLDGGAGDDVLIGGATGLDHMRGGDGTDTITYAGHATGVQIYLDSEVTWDGVTMDFLSSIENAIGSDHADYMAGNAADNRLDGGAGDDFLDGGAGDDLLIGGTTGLDHLRGGDGIDTITYAGHGTGVQIYLNTEVTWDGVTMDFLSSIENVVGSDHADYMAGNSVANRLEGGAGDDFLDGGAGDDILDGGTGVDQLLGGDGIDTVTYAGSARGVEIYLNNGISWDGVSTDFLNSIENVIGSDHADYIVGTAGANVINGGGGTDTVLYSANRAAYTISLSDGVTTITGPDGVDTLTNVERLQFADGLYEIGGNPIAAAAADLPHVQPTMTDDKTAADPQVLPGVSGETIKDSGITPEVLPVADDGFVVTGKFDHLPPVMPTNDEYGLPSPSDLEQARELMMALVRENPIVASSDSLTLVDDGFGIAAPSRGDVWQ